MSASESPTSHAPASPGATGQVGSDPWSFPLERIDPSDPGLFETDTHHAWFARLRQEDPVHFTAESFFGPYWSITRFADIVTVEKNHEVFTSGNGSIVIGDPNPDFPVSPGFIAMDGPRHIAHRTTVQPALAPRNLRRLEPLIRQRVGAILDTLPIGEEFDWVDAVSIELTTSMLATLFDFPYEERRRLTFWSDMATSDEEQVGATGTPFEERKAALLECLEAFQGLAAERKARDLDAEGAIDLVSLMAHGEAMQDLDPLEYLGTLILLIVGGNDTTRNSISGGVLALNEHPAEYAKLRADPGLVRNMVSEMIRWQTPLSHMRRNASRDFELAGKTIRAGDKVVMWYASANRDESAIERADEFRIDRKSAKNHLAFGWGVHFCVGSRLAEMQLQILWEELLQRYADVEVTGEPVRVRSNFVRGFERLPVTLTAR